MRQKKCRWCKEPFTPTYNTLQKCCSIDCAIKFTQKKQAEQERKELRERKKALKTRGEWYKDLQKEVNRYVRLRDHNQPCCTCGTTRPIKYDAGHYLTCGARPELRFELTNIHKQCSVNCNQHGSGMRKEYRDFLLDKYGEEHVAWLEGPHPDLKQQFPSVSHIEDEIKRYRKLIRDSQNII